MILYLGQLHWFNTSNWFTGQGECYSECGKSCVNPPEGVVWSLINCLKWSHSESASVGAEDWKSLGELVRMSLSDLSGSLFIFASSYISHHKHNTPESLAVWSYSLSWEVVFRCRCVHVHQVGMHCMLEMQAVIYQEHVCEEERRWYLCCNEFLSIFYSYQLCIMKVLLGVLWYIAEVFQ